MAIDQKLIDEYQNAEYVVYADSEFSIYVDTYSEKLKQLMTAINSNQAALITACNPYSERLNDADNTYRQKGLINELKEMALPFLQAIGQDKAGLWPGEKSLLVFNLTKGSACILGNKYQQNAILWIEADAVPRLLLLDGKQSTN